MNIKQLKDELMKRLEREEWTLSYDQKEDKLSILNKNVKKGAHLSLKPLLAKYEKIKEIAIEEAVRYVEVTLSAMEKDVVLKGKEKNIFPVIRATSFPLETKDGKKFVYEEHTAETRTFYAIDLGEYYQLIDEEMMTKNGFTKNELKEIALFNLRSLPYEIKEDVVAGNTFYFINMKDGYDASRILDPRIFDEMKKKAKGQLACAVPHQDVCLYADLVNDTGYDVLAQIVFQFFAQGKIPITALPFLVENDELEPTFILAQRKPKR